MEDHVLRGNERRDLWGMWTFKWGSNRGMGYSQEVKMKKRVEKVVKASPKKKKIGCTGNSRRWLALARLG